MGMCVRSKDNVVKEVEKMLSELAVYATIINALRDHEIRI